jgi:hypothetical protein
MLFNIVLSNYGPIGFDVIDDISIYDELVKAVFVLVRKTIEDGFVDDYIEKYLDALFSTEGKTPEETKHIEDIKNTILSIKYRKYDTPQDS